VQRPWSGRLAGWERERAGVTFPRVAGRGVLHGAALLA